MSLAANGNMAVQFSAMTPAELKAIRTDSLRLTQQELADKLGVQRNTVARWEMGIRRMPLTAERLLRIILAAQ